MICLRTALRPEILEKLSSKKFQKLSIMLDVAKQFETDFLENKSKSKTTPTTKTPTKIGNSITLIIEEMGLENAESVKKYVVTLKKSDSFNQTSNINSYIIVQKVIITLVMNLEIIVITEMNKTTTKTIILIVQGMTVIHLELHLIQTIKAATISININIRVIKQQISFHITAIIVRNRDIAF